jgi:hypothetical protein
MTNKLLKPSLPEAQRFLDALEQEGKFTFQTFDDRKGLGNRNLVRIIHGGLSNHIRLLQEMNQAGSGVFVTVNRTDLKGQGNRMRFRC